MIPFAPQAEVGDEDGNPVSMSMLHQLQESSRTLKIEDNRNVEATSGKPISKNSNFTGTYDIPTIQEIINESKKAGVDPYTALAISMQETNLGNSNDGNPMQLDLLALPKGSFDNALKNPIAVGVAFLKQKLEYGKKLGYKTEEKQIQAYNGYGKLTPTTELGMTDTTGMSDFLADPNVSQAVKDKARVDMDAINHPNKEFYGVPVTKDSPIDLSKNPLYGKRVIDLRENVIKKHPEIIKMVNASKQDEDEMLPTSTMQMLSKMFEVK